MEKFICVAGAYIYDPEKGDPEAGIEANTSFDDLPDDWECPVCCSPKETFSEHE